MKMLVVYDSYFGNTQRIAQAIGEALAASAEVEVLRVGGVDPRCLTEVDVLVVGSPTRAFSPSPATSKLLRLIPRRGLQGMRAAAFDTRLRETEIESQPVLRHLVKLFGYAAEPIAKRLRKKGAELALGSEGFVVLGTEGPLEEGELERAAAWAKRIATAAQGAR
jgi:flavodoxin I